MKQQPTREGSMPKIRPLFDKILVKREEAEDRSKGGIYLPEAAKEKPRRGKVVAVGSGHWTRDGKERIKMDVREGDVVTFTAYAGSEVEVGDEKFLVMSQQDVLAVIDP
jgi:chaperonin GroES